MDRGELEALVQGGETMAVEFKGESRHALSDSKLVEAVVCLANGVGGTLLLGVEDDGRVTGARPRHGDHTDPARVQALIANQTTPPVQSAAEVLDVGKLQVIAISVARAQRPVGTNSGLHVRRATKLDGRPECVPYPAHEMLSREVDRGAVDYAGLAVHGAEWSDLDPLEFERFRSLVARAGPTGDVALSELSDVEIARALGVATQGPGGIAPTVGGLLLFGREPAIRMHVPTHEVAFQAVHGNRVEVNEFSHVPLFKAADSLFEKVQARNPEEEFEMGLIRVAVPLVPQAAVREAVANALVHRDYTKLGPVRVQFTDDALEVISPGGFPYGVRLDNLLDVSQPRSPILADAFKRAGLVERTGRGINRMFEMLLRFGRDAPDYSRSTESSVVAVLPTGKADLGLTRFVLERESGGSPLSLPELQILNELRRDARMSTSEVAQLLQKTDSQARAVLARLVEAGLVELRGLGRGGRYHLAAGVYRALDAKSAYVRVHSFDAIQQQEMIMTYVGAHGKITRSQAAELCAIAPAQASALLRRMARDGRLELRGEKRGAHYVLGRVAERR